jgi:Sulfotransferase domain/N-terminal domain of galactosyltransferase
MINFCTTCRGRTSHLKLTLPRNLADNKSPNSRFVVLNYNSPDGLLDYVVTHHQEDLRTGKLVVYSFAPDDGKWHMAHAKSMAMRLGILEGADTVVTLDADNFAGPNLDEYIAANLEPGSFLHPDFAAIKRMPWTAERPLRGFAGRLAIRSQDFLKLGGYDEQFDIWGSEDIDLLGRLHRSGYTPKFFHYKNLYTIPHGPEVRFKEYPEAEKNEAKEHSRWIDSRTETVVNYGKFGMGTVYRNGDPTPITLGPVPTRVFGIGLHKTATSSLHKAFQSLGFDSLHWGNGEAPLIWQEVNAAGRSKTLERFYAACDIPIPLLYQKLDKAYPGSKFILTTRDESEWLTSVERMWDAKYNPTRWQWDVWPISNRLHTALYGRSDFDAQTMLSRYRQHNAEVVEYFKDRPDDLLVMDMSNGAGWLQICTFLGKPVQSAPYPREYPTREVGSPES